MREYRLDETLNLTKPKAQSFFALATFFFAADIHLVNSTKSYVNIDICRLMVASTSIHIDDILLSKVHENIAIHALHYSVDFVILSFGVMGFVVELRNY